MKSFKKLLETVHRDYAVEQPDFGMFKAIFVTGGPGSGKDVVIREIVKEGVLTELNVNQARTFLADKRKLSEASKDFRRESIRNRNAILINGPANDYEAIEYIKEELSELGYQVMMVFVGTTNEVSQRRNASLSKMMNESIRQDRWEVSQNNSRRFSNIFNNFVAFDNSELLESTGDEMDQIHEVAMGFLHIPTINEISQDWLIRNRKEHIKEQKNVKKDSKNIYPFSSKPNMQFVKGFAAAKGPADIKPDNSGGICPDEIKGNILPRKNPNGTTYTFGSGTGVYAESGPAIKFAPTERVPNFQKDRDTEEKKKKGDRSLSAARVGKPSGLGNEYDTRAGGQGAAAGAGLGNQTYSESQDYSNEGPTSPSMAGSSALQPNPLSEKKPFSKIRKNIKQESVDSPSDESGVFGTAGNADKKEPMDSYSDQKRKVGLLIKNKNNKGA